MSAWQQHCDQPSDQGGCVGAWLSIPGEAGQWTDRDVGLLGAGSNSDTVKRTGGGCCSEKETGGEVSKHGSGFFNLKQDMEALEGLEATYTPTTVH